MPDIRDYNLNRWGFVDDSGTLITIASSNVSIDELNSILGTINIVPNDDNYVLMVNGREAGVISITSQLKLKNVIYNPDTQSIEFTFDSDEGEKKVSVDVHELVDVYTAGQGLGVDKNQFFDSRVVGTVGGGFSGGKKRTGIHNGKQFLPAVYRNL